MTPNSLPVWNNGPLSYGGHFVLRDLSIALSYDLALMFFFSCEVDGGNTKLLSVSRDNMAAVCIRPMGPRD